MNHLRRVDLLVLFVALSGHVALGADPGSAESSALIEHATVEVVLIEAYVTDGLGRPIEALGPDDFVLMVDGRVRSIGSLEYRNVGSPSVAVGDDAMQVAPGLTKAPTRVSKYPRRFVLFYEDSTSAPNGLAAARRATERLLAEGLVPDDQVALAVYDRSLRLLHDFTNDRDILRQSVEASLADPKRLSDFSSEHGLADNGFAASVRGTVLDAMSYAAEETPRVRGALSALGTLIESLSPYPGYKGIVYMGDGLPENPAIDFLQRNSRNSSGAVLSRSKEYDLSRDIHQLAAAAATANVTLHSVQTSGLTVGSPNSVRRSNALETIALTTGGTASTSNDLFKALCEAEVASRAYYVLGYIPEGPPDGRDHGVQVRVRKSGARVRWRRSFTRLLPHESREHAIQAAYILPELYTDMGIELTLIGGPADDNGRLADLVIHVPPGRALFVPQEGGPAARLEAGFVIIDAAKHETLRAAREVHIGLGGGKGAVAPGLDFYSRIRLPREEQTITAVVSELSTGGLGAGRLVVPPANTVSRVVGLSIYSLSEMSLWVEIPGGQGAAPSSDRPAESILGPAIKATFSVGEPLASGFRLEGPPGAPELRLVIRNGGMVARTLAIAAKEAEDSFRPGGGPGTHKIRLDTSDLPAGDYVLAVQAPEENSEGSDLATVPFRLRASSAEAGSASGS